MSNVAVDLELINSASIYNDYINRIINETENANIEEFNVETFCKLIVANIAILFPTIIQLHNAVIPQA